MIRDPIKLLEYEAYRRPFLADLVARIDTVTDDEIASAPWPLKWIREAYQEMRKTISEKRTYAELDAALPDTVVVNHFNDRPGMVVQYTGYEEWVRSRGSLILLKSQVYLHINEQIWWGSSVLDQLPQPNRQIGVMTRDEYKRFIEQPTEDKPLFRISRF